jgi:hypothetical protein
LQEVTRHHLLSSLAEGVNAAIILSMLLQLIRRPYPILNHQPIKEFDLGGTQTFQIILLKRVQVAPNIGGLYISRS